MKLQRKDGCIITELCYPMKQNQKNLFFSFDLLRWFTEPIIKSYILGSRYTIII